MKNQSSQKQAKISKAIKDLRLLAEEQFMYQNILFEQINSMACPDFETCEIDKDSFEETIRFAIDCLDKRQAVEHVAKTVSERYEGLLRRVAELAFLGERNRDYYVDRVYSDSEKIQALLTAE